MIPKEKTGQVSNIHEKKYTITCTEEQLRLISFAIEDWTRFLSGQPEMFNAISHLENYSELRNKLESLQSLITPDLPNNASYGWNGGHCPNDQQRKMIAMGYGIYREILHFFAIKYNLNNVYSSSTLTCEEQGPLIKIEEL